MSGIGQLSGVALECQDPASLAEFYSAVTGWPVVYRHPDWYSIGEGDAFHLSFQRSPGYRPPIWPDPASSMQFHLHFRVPDLEEAQRKVLALGATHVDGIVFADPAGHPFCLVTTKEESLVSCAISAPQ